MGKKGKTDKGTAELIHELIRRFADQPKNETKISVADFLKLLTVLKELEQDEQGIDEIRVKWVERDKAA